MHLIHMPTQCVPFLPRAGIPYLERGVIRSRHDEVSRWAKGAPTHITAMPTQCANQGRVWQVWQLVPACQVWSGNVPLECLAQVREFLQVHEATIEDRSKIMIGSTAIEQMAHIGEVVCEQAQWHISGHPLLSKRQVSLGSVCLTHQCFVGQVTQILHGGNQFRKSSGSDEVLCEMIP